jgi:hypothetical protein
MKGPASPSELMQYVFQVEGEDAYPNSKSAREKAFKRDRESLRQRLGIEIGYSPSMRLYTLINPGPLLNHELSDASVRALALLLDTFGGHVGEHSEIQNFLEEIMTWLSSDSKRKLEDPSLPINLELFQQIDPNGIAPRVWKIVWRSVKEHRKLCFHYISPFYEDRRERYNEVIPYRIQFQWGHWYLRAYRVLRRDVDGSLDRHGGHLRYRLSYIQDDEQLCLSPTVVSKPPEAPKYLVHYRLLPPLSRGNISQHFKDMQFKTLVDGSVEVTGYADDEWEAGRILLSYGEFCVVLGGEEVLGWMQKTVQGIKKNYPDI